ncbi:MAG: hypothetical protein ACI9S8_000087 [Chlamydiales bacterium]|jgi:hypothetical protein
MVWVKKGKVFDPRDYDWTGTHAQVPTVLVKKDRLRVYYTDRDEKGKSYTTYVDLSKENPKDILYCHKKAVLSKGKPGTFDDEGAMSGFVRERDGEVHLYYNGWNLRETIPYHNSIGLAISKDGGHTFKRAFEGPLLDRTPLEPYLAVTPWVLKDHNIWHVWYVSGLSWEWINQKYEPIYSIKYAYSDDGLHWNRPNIDCIPRKSESEVFSHPTVIKKNDKFHMWFSYRECHDYRDGKGSYQMGYAESEDGKAWNRTDEVPGFEKSKEGWDSTMISYPYAVELNDRLHMFYNGNGFGQTGFGYAVWEN